MRFFGILFLTLLFSSIITALDIVLPGKFLINFIDNNYIETFAALIGLNLASITFLLGQFITIEATVGDEPLFDKARKQIKHNAFFLIFSFVFASILLFLRPDFVDNGVFSSNVAFYILNTFAVGIFFMALFAVFEILNSVFTIGKFFKKISNK